MLACRFSENESRQMFEWLKLLHVSCALVSVCGFALRGYWAVTDHPLRRQTLTRVLPHIVDTLLLGSAVGMLMLWQVGPSQLPWVMAKIVALLVYIGLGMVTMRFARSARTQKAAYCGALLVALYILIVARTHSPLGPVGLVFG